MIRKAIHLCAIAVLCALASCSNEIKPKGEKLESKVKIEAYVKVSDFPSASGVEYNDEVIYVVGDDSYDLRKYSEDWSLIESLPLMENKANNKRIPKDIKPDYESLCWMNPQKNILLVLPSGSDSPHRDSCMVFNVDKGIELTKKSLAPLYKQIWDKIGTAGNKINIEGVVNTGKHIYMFHRGNLNENIAVRIEINALINYLREFDENLVTTIDVYKFDLPEIAGFKAGMSGASYVEEHNAIIFTASVEGTASEIDDGEVLGSFIGWIDINTSAELKFCTPVIKDGNYLKTKLEGIAVSNVSKESINLITVSDDDKGNSELFKMSLAL